MSNQSVTEHRCPNCNTLISSGKHLCHACDLELAEWQRKRMTPAQPDHHCSCNLCGASYTAKDIPDAARWIGDHGCHYGKAPAQPQTPSPSLQELIFAIEEERRAKMQWARNAYAARAHADKLAKALRETADVRIWGKSSPIFARALAALSDYKAIKRGAQ